jgi:uncharacterized protein (TIGR04255 family)
VVEVACSVQFEELSTFQIPYAGFFWQEFRAQYPKFEEKPPLPHIIETFPEPSQPHLKGEFLELPPPRRIFFITESGTNVIQIQPDRFVHNWRKISDDDEYPRYQRVREIFLEQWNKFRTFADRHGLGDVKPDQFELTYVNHVFKGQGWDTPGDLGKVFRDLTWTNSGRFLPVPEGVFSRQSFVMPDGLGRLHCTVRQARRPRDGRELLMLELTARGFPKGSEPWGNSPMLSWFDLAHVWIVKGFVDLTAEQAHAALWRRTR